MSLRVLLADADGTLFDFHRGEAVAIGETFRRFGIPDTPGNLEIYSRVNHAQWLRLERGETTQERLRVDRFTDFLRETGLEGDAQALCDCYVELLGRQRYILSGAKEFCRGRERPHAHLPHYQRHFADPAQPLWRLCDHPLSLRYGDQRRGGACQAAPGHAVPGAGDGGLCPAGSDRDGRQRDRRHRRGQRRGVESILFTEGKEPPEGHGATYVARTYREALDILLAKAE